MLLHSQKKNSIVFSVSIMSSSLHCSGTNNSHGLVHNLFVCVGGCRNNEEYSGEAQVRSTLANEMMMMMYSICVCVCVCVCVCSRC